ncbi:Uncharacterised protein [Enterobacter asburiae]|nr:Uncharacterised protein [Enterobacter asburiae]
MQMNAGTITEENFLLFCILQPVAHFGINGGLQLCEVIKDLLRCFEQVGDGADASDFRRELNFAVWFLRIFRNHFRVVGKARLLHPENSRGRSATRRNQIADKQTLLRRRINTRQALRLHNTISNIRRSQSSLHRDADTFATFNTCSKGFQRFSRDHLLAD